MANDTTDNLLDSIRSRLPGVGTDQINLELFNTVCELATEALSISPPTDVDASNDSWLPAQYWVPNYRVLLEGTLFRLYAQANKPWSDKELAVYHAGQYATLLGLSRSDSLSVPPTVYQRLVNAVRVQVPQARESVITLALFAVANKIRVDALSLDPLTDAESQAFMLDFASNTSATPSAWLPDWDIAYNAMLYGTLAHLQAQVGQPWSSPEVAAGNLTLFAGELSLLRTDNASTPATVYQRLLNAVRVQLPQARESTVTMAAFAVANKIRLDALRLETLTDSDTNPSTWLPDWSEAYQAMLYGTLSRLQMQTGQPWSNPETAGANQTLFLEELIALRGEQVTPASSGMSKLMDMARTRLPGARDNMIQLELFMVMNEFFQETSCWTEEIQFEVTASAQSYFDNPDAYTYELFPNQGSIVRLMSLRNSTGFWQTASMETPGILILANLPSSNDTYTATVAKTVTDPTTRAGYPQFPSWVLNKYNGEILEGVLGRMMSQLAKPYSSPQTALFHLRNFKQGISKARAEALHSNVYRGQSWRFPQAFSTRRHKVF